MVKLYNVLLFLLLSIPATAHEKYSKELKNGDGHSCCDDQHCVRSHYCTMPDGNVGVALRGKCVFIPEKARVPSMDNNIHVCATLAESIPRCVLMPKDQGMY